jgi:hypothetical protein
VLLIYFLIKKINYKLNIYIYIYIYIYIGHFKKIYLCSDIFNDIFFQILRWWYNELTLVNLSNLWSGSSDCDNSIKKIKINY